MKKLGERSPRPLQDGNDVRAVLQAAVHLLRREVQLPRRAEAAALVALPRMRAQLLPAHAWGSGATISCL